MTNESFVGEVALVTGAASGIGRGVAAALAGCGANLVLSDIDAAGGTRVAAELRAAGARVAFVPADLAVADAHAALLRDAVAAFGPLTLFVHSASPTRHANQTVGRVTEAEWDAMLDTNVRAGFFLARAIGTRMVAEGSRGRMVFIASLHAATPRNLPHYSAAKAGQRMVVEELARFFGPAGIRVNAVAPGAIPGGGFAGDFEALARKIPLRRAGTPDDVARVVLALLSDAVTPYVTGTLLPVDGGLALYNWIEAAAAETG